MFSLTGATRYKYVPNYQDMRGGYDKLCSVLRHEHSECQLYVQRFDDNMSFVRIEFSGVSPVYVLEWKYLVAMLSCPVVKNLHADVIDGNTVM